MQFGTFLKQSDPPPDAEIELWMTRLPELVNCSRVDRLRSLSLDLSGDLPGVDEEGKLRLAFGPKEFADLERLGQRVRIVALTLWRDTYGLPEVLSLLRSPHLAGMTRLTLAGASVAGRELEQARIEAWLLAWPEEGPCGLGPDAREELGLLRAVLQAPEEDAPRLVYADWLEEHGDPRGGFIRRQCAAPDTEERTSERRGLLALLLDREPASFRRGFVEGLELTRLPTRALQLAAVQALQARRPQQFPPLPENVVVAMPELARLVTSLHPLRRLRLRLQSEYDIFSEWRELLRSPCLKCLHCLELQGRQWTNEPEYRGEVKDETVWTLRFTAEDAKFLVNSQPLQNLRELTLTTFDLSSEARQVLQATFGDRLRVTP
jgi:uncharacterized protein (TIGR02996 family)